ncbi:MAG: S41 family peptidase [Candidatus Heimdallarchaeota archaeon]
MTDQIVKISLTDKMIIEITKKLCKRIEEYYIFPKIAQNISNYVLNKLKQGLYNGITDPDKFVSVITNDLVKTSNDLHFYFEYNPLLALELLKEKESKKTENEDEFLEFKSRYEFEKYANFHITKAKRLPGNIGYIKMNDFPPAEFAGETIVGALQFLENSNAFIFDIRNNGGGYSSMVALIISYFIEPGTKLLNTFYERKKDKYTQSLTLPYIPGKKFPEKPLYVLISSRTASGAEEFAYNLKMMDRATLVGETTRGAANAVDIFPILDTFVIWLPIGRTINPISKDNWEGKGVSPHIEIRQEKALNKAHTLALKGLIENENDESIKKMLEFEYEYCNAKYDQINIDLQALQDFQGQYDKYKIFIQNNQLFYERSNLKSPLITKDNKTFFADETIKLWFEQDNAEKLIVLERRDYPNVLRIKKKEE